MANYSNDNSKIMNLNQLMQNGLKLKKSDQENYLRIEVFLDLAKVKH